MMPARNTIRPRCRGAVLVVSMIFIAIFSALAISMAAMSGTNVQIAQNQHEVNGAFTSAESGLEVARYHLSRVLIPSSTAPSDYLTAIVAALQSNLNAKNMSNIVVNSNGAIPAVTLDSTSGRTFAAQITSDANTPSILHVYVTGSCGELTRTIRVDFKVEPYEFPIFNFGLATKGPLNFPGNPTITAINTAWEADMYVESSNSDVAVSVIGNTNFDGDVSIGNPDANATFGGDVQIAGETGQTAIDNHVIIGADNPEFPAPDVDSFRQYATGQLVDSSTDVSKAIILTNATIKGGTNPTFGGSVTIQGILLIESPNKVTFGRNCTLQGLIVADGDIDNPEPGTNRIDFLGNFDTAPYPSDPEFDAIRDEVGCSIIGPGFATAFGGNFSTLEGVMAVSGVHFYGNANALIKGTIINYSDSPTIVEGNVTMNFDRVSSTKIPAGFDLYREVNYEPTSYSEICTYSCL
ncbi:MAG: pilus assembly PilX N-terminal domain-containing protein [Phycisphaerales bacterium]|nr:MAG: pilus assembly PilX N-terminal domain-containing protein [Phycisphaerales bacterium]